MPTMFDRNAMSPPTVVLNRADGKGSDDPTHRDNVTNTQLRDPSARFASLRMTTTKRPTAV